MGRTFVLAALLAGCTATHPLDSYSSEYGKDGAPDAAPADDSGAPAAADADVDDAGCAGDPTILEPLPNATVGATMHLRVSAPTCIATMIVYLDYKDVLHIDGNAIDQSIPLSVGTHKLNVNGWAHTANAHASPLITITRAQ
ncbi:MAG TPA: hypothetical protein VIF62_08490 [Labilithrix sp.]|jgi:hypothetical protein